MWTVLTTSGGDPLHLAALLCTAAMGGGVAIGYLIRGSALLRREGRILAAQTARLRHLLDSDARVREVLERLPDPVVLRDGAGRVLLDNAAFRRLVSEGHGIVESRTGPAGSRSVDEAVATPDGLRWFSWTETVLDTAGSGSARVLRSGREITDRVGSERALEEARARAETASEAKSRFLATVSHEFRTPLNGILGMSDLLLDTRLEPEQATYVGALRSSAEAFLSLIEEILDFSRIEAGRIDLRDEPFEIEPLVQGVVELLAPRAQDKGIEIACFVSEAVPAYVDADRDRLRQILFNLAGNAVKFTDAGGVCLSVEAGPDGAVVFAVTDTGRGIAPDRIGTIFEEFEQGGLEPARGTGTGLGLAITRRIVDRMSGRIDVESHPGEGSAFRVSLPLRPAAGARPRSERQAATGLKVLLVGGSPFEPICLERRLAEAGAETARAPDVREGAALMGENRFDVLIVDGAAGDMDVRMAARLARLAGIGRTIVLLSPFERRGFGPPAAAGFDAYLTKPVRSRSLFERLAGAPAEARPPAAEARRRPDHGSGAVRPRRVLLAEDNEVNALLAMKALEKLGALVEWARDGSEALGMAEAAMDGARPAYDLILMDMRMPGMDGAEVTRRIREREAAGPHEERCRIVALTASIVGGRERYRETAGFDGFLTKPFTFDQLAAELDPALALAS